MTSNASQNSLLHLLDEEDRKKAHQKAQKLRPDRNLDPEL